MPSDPGRSSSSRSTATLFRTATSSTTATKRLLARAPAREKQSGGVGEGPEQRNLFAVTEQLAARGATPSTRRQYAAIYRAFGDWLRHELGCPPVVGDLDGDVIAAYARYLRPRAGAEGARPRWPRGGSICR